ncbi:unnamed protein product [Cunninghamella blakesleeana]
MLAPCPSFKVSVGIPIFGLGFTKTNQLILCGGGGAGRSGVKNKLCSYKVDIRRKDLEEEAVYDISFDEDAPMCLSVHPNENVVVAGINSSPEKIKSGDNENCRLFNIDESAITFAKSVQTLKSQNEADYQKVVRFNKDGSLLATGTTDGVVKVYKYSSSSSIEELTSVQVVENDDILDVDFNTEDSKLTAVVADGIKLINLRGKNLGNVIQTVSASTVHKKYKVQFRAFRYGVAYSENLAFAVANSNGKSKAGFICILDAYTLEIKKVVQVSKKPITTFCLSTDGSVIGFGNADLSLTLLEAKTLTVLTQVKNAHGFSITSIAISPDRRMLVSGSADNTCCIVDLPIQFPAPSINPVHTILLALLVAGSILLITSYLNTRKASIQSNQKGMYSILPVGHTGNVVDDPSLFEASSTFKATNTPSSSASASESTITSIAANISPSILAGEKEEEIGTLHDFESLIETTTSTVAAAPTTSAKEEASSV